MSRPGEDLSASRALFEFRKVSRWTVAPSKGPVAGGTLVTATADRALKRGARYFCSFGGERAAAEQVGDAALRCAAPPGAAPGSVALEVRQNGLVMTRTAASVSFTYYESGPPPPPPPPSY